MSFVVLLQDNAADVREWKEKKKSVGWIIKSCARRSLGHINSHRNMSVIEKWGDNEKETNQGSGSFRSPLGLTDGKEGKENRHLAVHWRTCQNFAVGGKDGEKEMKGVRNAEKREVGKKGKECGSAKLWSF